ncbi:hypothetical protein RND71_012677 [Anisodus tanguticus]|uniref:Uncharacterized protein n=1 Tax=Anisodus tanguticus TaxID=243964 RepID=A0AAE1SFN0_9SOLA|nr:hypothetical protein RND71_012677 [Anisodus tanguticus]
MKDVPPATSVYWPNLSSLLLTASGSSHSTGTDGISPGTQQETTNAIETLSRYLNRISLEYGVNGQFSSSAIFSSHLEEFEGDLRQNLNVDDPRVRHRTMRTIGMMFDYLGSWFGELGSVMIDIQMGENGDDIDNGTGLTELFVKEGIPSGSSTIEPTSAHELADEVTVFHTLNIKCNLPAISIRF